MPLKSVYRKDPPFVVSYDYFDYSNGTGYDIYYGFSNAGTEGTITQSGFYSGMIHKNGVEVTLTDQNTYYELLDFDWDIIFNIPRSIKGDILIQIPFGVLNNTGSTKDFNIKAECLVYHYNGGETQIGSTATSEELTAVNLDNGLIRSHITTLKINAASVVNFAKGDILRFTIKVYAKCTDAASSRVYGGVGCDPQNRTDATIQLVSNDSQEIQIINTDEPTQMVFHVPFRIQT